METSPTAQWQELRMNDLKTSLINQSFEKQWLFAFISAVNYYY